MSPSQRNRLHEIKVDLIVLNDMGKIDLTPVSMNYVQNWIDTIIENDDGINAWRFIGQWNTKAAIEAISEVLKSTTIIIK